MRSFPDREMWSSGKRYASKGRTYRLGRGDEKRAARYLACRLLYITYIRTTRGFVYLVAIIDWFSRYILAWEISIILDVNFC